jgi:hypothetical protein
MKALSSLLLLSIFCSCGSSSHNLTGTKRAPIHPDSVKLYLDPPTTFETIGIVEASRGEGFKKQATQNIVIKKIKKQAAKLGANGILISSNQTQSSGPVGYMIEGIYFTTTSSKVALQGRAIVVTEE